MKFDYTQGDPRIVIGPSGATLSFTDGQPVMDQGLENAIIISLFSWTWFGNVFMQNPNSHLKSRFEKAHYQPINLSVINNDIPDAGAKDLAPLIEAGLFSKVDILTINDVSGAIATTFLFHPPGSDIFKLQIENNGKNWIAQFKYPASERV